MKDIARCPQKEKKLNGHETKVFSRDVSAPETSNISLRCSGRDHKRSLGGGIVDFDAQRSRD